MIKIMNIFQYTENNQVVNKFQSETDLLGVKAYIKHIIINFICQKRLQKGNFWYIH